MNLTPVWASSIAKKCAIVMLGFVLTASSFAMIGRDLPVERNSNNPEPSSATYYAIPTDDPDDGKFLGVFGSGMQTLSGLTTVIYIGVPGNQTDFEVGIFDAEVTANWDYDRIDRGVTLYKVYKDPYKDGNDTMLLGNWSSENGINDEWYNETYLTDSAAQAPSGNFFYRLEIGWEDPSLSTANLFKVRSTGQLSLALNQEFGFAGAPQNTTADPCVGEPGNSYDGKWDFYFYIPRQLTEVSLRDGDFDRAGDTDDFNTPNVDPDGGGPAIAEGVNPGQPEDNGGGNPYGACAIVQPSVNYSMVDPAGVEYKNINPSGNTEWEIFNISYGGADSDHNSSKVLPAGLWQLKVDGLDGHNGGYLNTSFEAFVNLEQPLPINPPPRVEPDKSATVQPGDTVEYQHQISNDGLPANYDLTAISSNGWTTRIYRDSNLNGKVDPGEPQINETGLMGQKQMISIVVQLDVPLGTEGKTDKMVVTASSQSEWAVQGSATDTTVVISNEGPVAEGDGPYSAYENTPIVFNGNGSYDPDGDPLEYRWDFEGDMVWDTNWSTSPTVSRTWGDDCSGTAILEVRDPAGETARDTASWEVRNTAPSGSVTTSGAVNEGGSLNLTIGITDPGSDDVKIQIDWGDGHVETREFYNDGVGPDPYPSPRINPVNITLTSTHIYGDDWTYAIDLKAADDDGGLTSFGINFMVGNLDPVSMSFSAPTEGDEGFNLDFKSEVSDPGSDDLTFVWDWGDGTSDTEVFYNDGVGPDPDPSPGGTFPFNATSSISHIWGDNGIFNVNLVVSDDDGGSFTASTTAEIKNLAPRILAQNVPGSSDEGEETTLWIMAGDPGSDDLIMEFDWGDGTTETIVHYNDGAAPDPYPSPGGVYPFVMSDNVTHIYGDDGNFTIGLNLSDDDGGSITFRWDISVDNVDPTIDPSSVEAKAIVDLTLRVSGEKWHDVSLEIMRAGTLVQLIHIIREPGSPDEQSKTEPNVTVNLFEDVPLIVQYTPMDDPINGQLWGSTPVWVIIGFEDGSEAWLNHTFNVRHPNTWTWEIRDISKFFIGKDMTFSATATDPGSDDLTFLWDWGDGTTSSSLYYNNGVSPDPYPSPDVNPMTVTDIQLHAFMLPKVYTITLTVTDDDGGLDSLSFTLKL